MEPTDQDVINAMIEFNKANSNGKNSLVISVNLSQLVFIPSIPYDSKEISEENGNLWELHELRHEQEITIIINPLP